MSPNDARLKRRTVLEVLTIAGAGAIAGCSGDSGDGDGGDGGGDDTPTQGSMADRHGGNLRIGGAQIAQTLNPFQQKTAEGFINLRWMYSNLTQFTLPDLGVEPDLATDWEANDDASQWTFELRDDVTFNHNGQQVIAEDVKATIEAALEPDVASSGKSVSVVDSVAVIDDQAVEFTLNKPFSPFPKAVARPWGRIIPKDVIENDYDSLATSAFGSGPYVLDSYKTGSELTVTQADDYYKELDGDQLPYFDEITMLVQPESVSRINAIKNKETQLVDNVSARDVANLQQAEGVEIEEIPGGWFYPIIMDTTVAPFNDRGVREAIKYAVDRKATLDGARDGHGTVGQDTPVTPAHQFYADLDNKYGTEAKVDKAQEVLEEAGYGDGLEIDNTMEAPVSHDPPIKDTAILLQEQLEEVGISFEIEQVAWDRFLSEVETQSPFYVSTYSFRPFEDAILRVLLTEGGTFYGTNWHESEEEKYNEFTDAIDAAVASPDPEVVQEHYRTAQELVRDYAGVVIPFFKSAISSRTNNVKNYRPDPTGTVIELENVYFEDE